MLTNQVFRSIILTALLMFTISCENGSNVYQESSNSENTEPQETRKKTMESKVSTNAKGNEVVHEVEVKQVLPASSYVYLLVEEHQKEFWIATRKIAVTVGNTYMFSDGLVQYNFESKEHNRVFDTLILVSNLINPDGTISQEPLAKEAPTSTVVYVEVKNSTRIGDLVASPSKFTNKKIQVSGVCTKVNSNIMGKNWVHLDDGTNDGFDFIVTTNETIQNGQTVTMKGIVATDKDFGAGYTFDLILEEGIVVTI